MVKNVRRMDSNRWATVGLLEITNPHKYWAFWVSYATSPTRKKHAEACFFQLYSPSASDIVFRLCSVALSCIVLRAAKKANRISLQPKGEISLCSITAKYRISQSEIFHLFFRGFESIQQKRKSIFFLLHRQRMRFLSLVFYLSKISKPAPHCTDSTMWGSSLCTGGCLFCAFLCVFFGNNQNRSNKQNYLSKNTKSKKNQYGKTEKIYNRY